MFSMKNINNNGGSGGSNKIATRPGYLPVNATANNVPIDVVNDGDDAAAALAAQQLERSTDCAVQLLTSLPSSDHALAYVVLSSGVSSICIYFGCIGIDVIVEV